MMNCRGCGVELEPSEEQINQGVDQILSRSLDDAVRTGGVCPLCGHSKEVPVSHRKTVQFALLLACLMALAAVGLFTYRARQTQRILAANVALSQLQATSALTNLLGTPLSLQRVSGEIRHDETGWLETELHFGVQGPHGSGIVHAIGGRGNGEWKFTTLEVLLPSLQKRVDVISGTVVEYDPDAYVEVHTQAAAELGSQAVPLSMPTPTWDGEYPCIAATVAGDDQVSAELGKCGVGRSGGAVERFEADLRYGYFVVRETDMVLGAGIGLPLTRTYNSGDWVHPNPIHAFGRYTNHPFDIAPVGSRNPYTYMLLALEDGNFVYFPRVSQGTGYADAVYQHSETSTRYYGSTLRWNGHGWTLKFSDGSETLFPESYNAKNMAQGAPTEIADGSGNKVALIRDGKRNLQEIKAASGDSIRFTYDDQSRITRVDGSNGRWTTYQYNSNGMLTDVRRSSGSARHFSYNGSLMTSVTDENNQVLVRNRFDGNTLIEQTFLGGATYRYRYDNPSSRPYAKSVTVTTPNGGSAIIEVENSVPWYLKNLPKK